MGDTDKEKEQSSQRALRESPVTTCEEALPTEGRRNKILTLLVRVCFILPLKLTPVFCLLYWVRTWIKIGRLLRQVGFNLPDFLNVVSRKQEQKLRTEVLMSKDLIDTAQASSTKRAMAMEWSGGGLPVGSAPVQSTLTGSSTSDNSSIRLSTGAGISTYTILTQIIPHWWKYIRKNLLTAFIRVYTLSELFFFVHQKFRLWSMNNRAIYPPRIPQAECVKMLTQELNVIDLLYNVKKLKGMDSLPPDGMASARAGVSTRGTSGPGLGAGSSAPVVSGVPRLISGVSPFSMRTVDSFLRLKTSEGDRGVASSVGGIGMMKGTRNDGIGSGRPKGLGERAASRDIFNTSSMNTSSGGFHDTTERELTKCEDENSVHEILAVIRNMSEEEADAVRRAELTGWFRYRDFAERTRVNGDLGLFDLALSIIKICVTFPPKVAILGSSVLKKKLEQRKMLPAWFSPDVGSEIKNNDSERRSSIIAGIKRKVSVSREHSDLTPIDSTDQNHNGNKNDQDRNRNDSDPAPMASRSFRDVFQNAQRMSIGTLDNPSLAMRVLDDKTAGLVTSIRTRWENDDRRAELERFDVSNIEDRDKKLHGFELMVAQRAQHPAGIRSISMANIAMSRQLNVKRGDCSMDTLNFRGSTDTLVFSESSMSTFGNQHRSDNFLDNMNPGTPRDRVSAQASFRSAAGGFARNIKDQIVWNVNNVGTSISTSFRKLFYMMPEEEMVPFEEIRRENAREWLAWAFLNDIPTPLNRHITDELLEIYETWSGTKLVKGYNPDIISMRITLDQIKAAPRPIIYYAFTQYFVPFMFETFVLRKLQFYPAEAGSMKYWVRKVDSRIAPTEEAPLKTGTAPLKTGTTPLKSATPLSPSPGSSGSGPYNRNAHSPTTRPESNKNNNYGIEDSPVRPGINANNDPPNNKGAKKSRRSIADEHILGPDPSMDNCPLVFCHGIGVGAAGYVPFLEELIRVFPYRTIFLVSLPHISMQMEESVMSASEVVACIGDMLIAHYDDFHYLDEQKGLNIFSRGSDDVHEYLRSSSSSSSAAGGSPPDVSSRKVGAHFIGHSFGSIVMSWVLRKRPELVRFASFIDPVCFLLAKPDLTFNFVYREPRTWLQVLLQYFISQELHLAHTLARKFYWQQNILWAETLECPTSVSLCALDSIIPALMVRLYLAGVDAKRKRHNERLELAMRNEAKLQEKMGKEGGIRSISSAQRAEQRSIAPVPPPGAPPLDQKTLGTVTSTNRGISTSDGSSSTAPSSEDKKTALDHAPTKDGDKTPEGRASGSKTEGRSSGVIYRTEGVLPKAETKAWSSEMSSNTGKIETKKSRIHISWFPNIGHGEWVMRPDAKAACDQMIQKIRILEATYKEEW